MVSKGPAEGYQRKVTSVWRCCEPRFYTLLPLLAEYNYAKVQNCTIKLFELSHHNENVDEQTDWQTNKDLCHCGPRMYTLLSLIVEYNCAKFQNCTIKTFWVIASQLWLSHQDENVYGQTNGQADGTQNIYPSASYCRVQLCQVSNLYDKNFLSYCITTSIITSRRKCWRTDERTGGRNAEFIHVCLLL